MIAAGFVNVVLITLANIGIVSAESSTYKIVYAVYNAAFYFLPIYVGYYAAKRFGATPSLGMLLGGAMCHPDITALIGSGEPVVLAGLSVFTKGVSYTSSIIPIILCCWVMAYIEKFFNRKLPAMLRTMFAPFFTILIMIPLTFCLIGPLGGMIGTLAGGVLGWLYTNFGALSVGILAALTPLIIMTGLHLATIVPYCILCMTTMGFDPMTIPAAFVINICLGVSAIAVGIKTKDNTLKGQAFSSGFTSVFAGIREPALFGINLKYMKPWIGFGIKILDSPRKSH